MQPARFCIRSVFGLSLLLGVAACGSTPQDRTLTGAGIGALVGAGVGVITDADTGTAAVVGALGGALIGAVTDESGRLNTGTPIWRR